MALMLQNLQTDVTWISSLFSGSHRSRPIHSRSQ